MVYFGPKTFLQGLFGVLEGSGFLDEVEVGEDANDFGKAVRLEDVEELECFLVADQLEQDFQRRRTHHFEAI